MNRKIKLLASVFTIFFANIFSLAFAFQNEEIAQDSLKYSNALEDSISKDFAMELDEFLILQDHDLATWVNQFPHTWISKSPQVGHPHQVQLLGQPVWMTDIRWRGMSMNDPVFGLFDLNFLPLISIEKMESQFTGFNIHAIKMQSPEPYSQVYYRQGQNGESEVDVMFQRGMGESGYFQVGGTFNKFGGHLENSAVDDQKVRMRLHFPFFKNSLLTYQLLTRRNKAEYPGDNYEDSIIQFSNLKRKIRRSDHFLNIDFPFYETWKKNLILEYHHDRRDYTDNTDTLTAINTEDVIKWGKITGLISRQLEKSILKASLTIKGAGASSLGFGSFHEFPIGMMLSTQRNLKKTLLAEFKAEYTYYNSEWQSHKIRFGLMKRFQPFSKMNLIAFNNSSTPPLGWRKGKLLPFENQPWPLLYSSIDTTFQFKNRPQQSVSTRGIQIQFSWNKQNQTRVFADLLFQRTNDPVFPASNPDSMAQITHSASYSSLGLFLKLNSKLNNWMLFSGKYQFSHFSKISSPELLEIPSHNLWLQLHLNKIFKGSLDAHFFLTSEYFSNRMSTGFPRDSVRVEKISLDDVVLFHAKFMLHIGDARVFFQWQNLLGQEYAFRIFQSQPGADFQYGVIWNFWN